MIALTFDTETTGLPIGRPDTNETHLWPHVVQLSYCLYDTDANKLIATVNQIVRIADDIELPQEAVDVHGITRERSKAEGVHIKHALHKFRKYAAMADCLVAHNLQFDFKMLTVESLRWGVESTFRPQMPQYCTMNKGRDTCAITRISKFNGKEYYKMPTLTELHHKLFGTDPKGVHDAMVDVLVCLRCYTRIRHSIDDLCISCPEIGAMYCAI